MNTELDRTAIESALATARRRAADLAVGSPSWAAAMELVDELEVSMARLQTREFLESSRPTARYG